ncbi:MAG: polysaccharide biosynthesis C-terminal domain-containing protein [Bacteroidia bacterium]
MGVIQRQSIKNFFTSYIGILIGFVNILIIQPRFLSAEELGLTRVLYSFALLLSTFVPLGIANITVKFFPNFRNSETRHHGFFGFSLLGTFAGFIITALLIFGFKNLIIPQYIEKSKLFADFFYWVFPFTFLLSFATQLNLYCYSIFKSTVPGFINDVIVRLGIIIVVSLYYLKLFSLPVFISLFVLVYGLQIILLLFYIYYEEKPGFKIDWGHFKKVGVAKMFSFAAIVWLASLGSVGLKELATVILGTKVILDNVAIYVVAAFIPTLIEAPLGALDKIATFKISSAFAHDNLREINEIYKKSAKYMLLLGGLLFLGINGNINSLLQFLPEKYRGGADIVFIISCGTLFNMGTGLNSQVLFYSRKYYYAAMMMVIAVLINFTLQLSLIPPYGLRGAAFATAFSGVILNLVNSFIVWKHYKLSPVEKNTFKVILLIMIVGAIDYFIPHFSNALGDIFLHSIIIGGLYISGSYLQNFVPELTEYVSRMIKK